MRALVLFVGISCNSSDPANKVSTASQNAPGSAATSAPAAAVDWSGKKLVEAGATVDGVAFTLRLPEGLKPHPRDPGVWSDARDEGEHTIRVFATVLDGPLITSLDKAKYQSTLRMSEAKFVRADEQPNGYAITNLPVQAGVEATTFTRTGEHWLKCKASHVPVAKLDKARAVVESICDSVALK